MEVVIIKCYPLFCLYNTACPVLLPCPHSPARDHAVEPAGELPVPYHLTGLSLAEPTDGVPASLVLLFDAFLVCGSP